MYPHARFLKPRDEGTSLIYLKIPEMIFVTLIALLEVFRFWGQPPQIEKVVAQMHACQASTFCSAKYQGAGTPSRRSGAGAYALQSNEGDCVDVSV
jgi:hypothetical protein